MDGVVIDANVFAGFFIETVIGKEHDLTASPSPIFDELGQTIIGFLDEQGHLESEWRRLVEPEWFDAWLAHGFSAGLVMPIPVDSEHALIKSLRSKYGFPESGDVWLIRVAKSVANKDGDSTLVAEDLDFFNPKRKSLKGDTRKKVLEGKNAPVQKFLRKSESIRVCCVSQF